MKSFEIRQLEDVDEASAAHRLVARNPDKHMSYVVDRLPTYFEIERALDPVSSYLSRQRMLVGAFAEHELVGTVSVQRVVAHSVEEASDSGKDARLAQFSEQELQVFNTLRASLWSTYIGSPEGSLMIHSLCVDASHRCQGIARAMLLAVVQQLDDVERASLYIEIARSRWLQGFCEGLGFQVVQKTFSVSEGLEFGSWGSVLLRFSAPAE